MEAQQLKLLARSVTPVDSVASGTGGMGLKVYVDTEAAIFSVKSLLDRMATARLAPGPLEFCIFDSASGNEFDVSTGLEYPLTPQIKGALKSLEGVVTVEDI